MSALLSTLQILRIWFVRLYIIKQILDILWCDGINSVWRFEVEITGHEEAEHNIMLCFASYYSDSFSPLGCVSNEAIPLTWIIH